MPNPRRPSRRHEAPARKRLHCGPGAGTPYPRPPCPAVTCNGALGLTAGRGGVPNYRPPSQRREVPLNRRPARRVKRRQRNTAPDSARQVGGPHWTPSSAHLHPQNAGGGRRPQKGKGTGTPHWDPHNAVGGKHRPPGHGGHALKDCRGLQHHLYFQTS